MQANTVKVKVTIVTVVYGSRWEFLKQVADACLVEKVGAELRAMMPWISKKKLVDSDKS